MFTFSHQNINVLDLERSLRFYSEALGLSEARRLEAPDKNFTIVWLEAPTGGFQLELTWMHDRKEPYNLGDNEFHLAFTTDSFSEAHERHQKMGCIVYENKEMGIYFITDPDGYWLEILPE